MFQRLLEAMRRIAIRRDLSIANIASLFILEQPAVAAVIIGARLGESEHIESNRALLGASLDDERAVRSVFSARESAPGAGRLRRRVSQAALPDRNGRPEPPSRHVARAFPDESGTR